MYFIEIIKDFWQTFLQLYSQAFFLIKKYELSTGFSSMFLSFWYFRALKNSCQIWCRKLDGVNNLNTFKSVTLVTGWEPLIYVIKLWDELSLWNECWWVWTILTCFMMWLIGKCLTWPSACTCPEPPVPHAGWRRDPAARDPQERSGWEWGSWEYSLPL